MTRSERFDRFVIAEVDQSLGLRGESVVSFLVLSHEDWSNTNWIPTYMSFSRLRIMDDECKNTV